MRWLDRVYSRLVTRRVLEVVRQVRTHINLERVPYRRINLVRLVRDLEALSTRAQARRFSSEQVQRHTPPLPGHPRRPRSVRASLGNRARAAPQEGGMKRTRTLNWMQSTDGSDLILSRLLAIGTPSPHAAQLYRDGKFSAVV